LSFASSEVSKAELQWEMVRPPDTAGDLKPNMSKRPNVRPSLSCKVSLRVFDGSRKLTHRVAGASTTARSVTSSDDAVLSTVGIARARRGEVAKRTRVAKRIVVNE
jgi:hypothetical protein